MTCELPTAAFKRPHKGIAVRGGDEESAHVLPVGKNQRLVCQETERSSCNRDIAPKA